MRALLVVMVMLAGCGELPAEPEREDCPRTGYVRSAPLDPIAATAQPPAEALVKMGHAFSVDVPQGDADVMDGQGGQTWVWQEADRVAVALVVDGIAQDIELRVNGTRFGFDAAAAQQALESAAERLGVPGKASRAEGGAFRFTWDTGIVDGGGPSLQESHTLNRSVYRMQPAYRVPDDLMPSSVYGSIPVRAMVCTLANAGAFLGASGAVLHEDMLVLDSEQRLEKVFVYRLQDADCQRDVHVRFDARSGNLVAAALQSC